MRTLIVRYQDIYLKGMHVVINRKHQPVIQITEVGKQTITGLDMGRNLVRADFRDIVRIYGCV